MTGPLVAELVAYEPGTETVAGHLPEPLSWDASMVHNDVGSLRLTYTRKAVGGGLLARGLAEGLDIGLRLSIDGGEWFEPDGGRFPLVRRDVNPADTQETVTLTLPSYGWLLSKMRILALDLLEVGGDFDGQRLFEAVNAGKIMHPLLGENMARHADPLDIDWGFTAAVDSAAVAWPATDWAIPYAPGTDYRTILAGLASMGLCDWRTRGRELMAWVADTQFANRAEDVRLHLGVDVADAPSTETLEDVASYTLVRGEGNVIATVIDGTAPTPWGAWEGYLQAAGATTEAEAQEMVARDIEARARVTGQYTQTLILGGAQVLPWRDYVPGDVVSAHGSSGMAAMRVQQVTLSYSGGQLGGSVVLNDRLVPAELRQARTLRALAKNAAISGTGSVIPETDTRTPKAPGAPTLSDQRILDAVGVWRSRIGASWLAVTQATNGTALSPVRYELWGQPMTGGAGVWRRLTTAPDGALSAAWEPFDTGSTWRFAVKAVGPNGKASELGAFTQWTFGPDTTPPPKPSTPTASIYLGSVTIGWDGKGSAGESMPADFDRADVHISTASGFTPSAATSRSQLRRVGTVSITGLAYGVVHYARLVAFDLSGNASPVSDQVAFVPAPLGGDDVDDELRGQINTGPVAYGMATQAIEDALAAQGTADDALTLSQYSRMVLADPENYAPNGDFRAGLDGWAHNPYQTVGMSDWEPIPRPYVNTPIQADTNHDMYNDLEFPVAEGDQFMVRATVFRSGPDAPHTVGVGLHCFDGAGGNWWPVAQVSGTSTQIAGTVVVPAGARLARACLLIYNGGGAAGGSIGITGVIVRKRLQGQLIVDGTVDTDQLAANAATVGKLSVAAFEMNMLPNGRFEDGWQCWDRWGDGGYYELAGTASGVPKSGKHAVGLRKTGGNNPVMTNVAVPVNGAAGLPIAWRILFCNWSNNTGNLVFRVLWFDGNLTQVAYHDLVWQNPGNPWDWVRRTGRVLPPAEARYMQAQLIVTSGDCFVDHVAMVQAIEGDLMVDNTVLARHMSAEEMYSIRNFAGPLDGNHTRMEPDGFRAFGPNPQAGDAIQPYAGFGNGMWFGFDQSRPLARVTGEGHGSFASVSTDALRVAGQTLEEILWPLPKGTIAYTNNTVPVTGIGTTSTPVVELRCILEAGRLYEVASSALAARSSVAGDVAEWDIHVAYDGNPVTTSSALIKDNMRTTLNTATVYEVQPGFVAMLSTEGQAAATREARFLLTCRRYSGSGTIDVWGSSGQPAIFEIEDEGAYRAPSSTGIRYVSEWDVTAAWQHSGSGTLDATWINLVDVEGVRQSWGQVVFGGNAVSGETSRSVASAMAGASLLKAEVRISLEMCEDLGLSTGKKYNYTPVLQLRPTPNTGANSSVPGGLVTTAPYDPPQMLWSDITSQWNGSHRGLYVTLPSAPSDRRRMGFGGTYRIRLRLTYTR